MIDSVPMLPPPSPLYPGLFVLIGAFAPTPATAFQMIDSAFEVYHTVDGKEVAEATTMVPLRLNDETCWYWFIRSADTAGDVTFTERLIMPGAPKSWGDVTATDPEEVEPLRIEHDGTVGVSSRRQKLDDGWFSHGWCLLPGDPTGPHTVEISVDGMIVRRFEFEVVPPLGDATTRVVRPNERGGRFSY